MSSRSSYRKKVKSGEIKPSTFWTMKENPTGASIGNVVKNYKAIGNDIKTAIAPLRSKLSQGAYKPIQKVSEPQPMTISKTKAVLQPRSRLSGGRRILMK